MNIFLIYFDGTKICVTTLPAARVSRQISREGVFAVLEITITHFGKYLTSLLLDETIEKRVSG